MEDNHEGVDWHREGCDVTWMQAIGLAFGLFVPFALTTVLYFVI